MTDNVIDSRERFAPKPSLTDKALAKVGHLGGTEARMHRVVSDVEARTFGRRRLAVGAGLGLVASALTFTGKVAWDVAHDSADFQNRVVACANRLEGDKVNVISVNADGVGHLVVSPEDLAYVDACRRADADIQLARDFLPETRQQTSETTQP